MFIDLEVKMLSRPSSLSCQLERAKHTIHQPLDRQPLRQLKGICFAIGLWIVEHERWKSIENFGQKFLQRMRRSFTASKQISVLASRTRTSTLLYKIDSKFWFPISQEKLRRFLAIAGHFWNQNARISSFSKQDNRLTASFSWIGGKELPVFHNVYSLYPPPFFLGYRTAHNVSAVCHCKKSAQCFDVFRIPSFSTAIFLQDWASSALSAFRKQHKLTHKLPGQRHLLMSSNVIQEDSNIQSG